MTNMIIVVDKRGYQFVADSQVQREAWGHFPIILEEIARFPVVNVHGQAAAN